MCREYKRSRQARQAERWIRIEALVLDKSDYLCLPRGKVIDVGQDGGCRGIGYEFLNA